MGKNNDLYSELRDAVKIDKHDMDNVVLEHSEIWLRVAELHVSAVGVRDELKTQVKELHAELDIQFRKKAAEDDEKLTDTACANKIISSPKMKNLQNQLLIANREADRWQALREAFGQRNDMLKLWGKLYSDANYMTDSVGRESSEAKDRLARRSREEAGRMRRGRHRDD